MAILTIRNLNDKTIERLRRLATPRGHSVEEEARRILDRAVNVDETTGLGTTIVELVAEVGGVELEIPPRSMDRRPPPFEAE